MRCSGPSPAAEELVAMLRAGARGLCAGEAVAERVLGHGYWIGAVLRADGTAGVMVTVPAPPAFRPGAGVVAVDGTVVQEGGAGGR